MAGGEKAGGAERPQTTRRRRPRGAVPLRLSRERYARFATAAVLDLATPAEIDAMAADPRIPIPGGLFELGLVAVELARVSDTNLDGGVQRLRALERAGEVGLVHLAIVRDAVRRKMGITEEAA